MGSNPMFPIMVLFGNIYDLIRLINMARANNINSIKIKYNFKVARLVILLSKLGLFSFYIYKTPQLKYFKITFHNFYLNYSFKKIITISTRSKQYYINYINLLLLSQKLGNTQLLLNTAYGIITHSQALKLKIGGNILCLILN